MLKQFITLLLFLSALVLALAQPSTQQGVDPDSPKRVKPFTQKKIAKYKLVFSDEFNDAEINEDKWTVMEDFERDRNDFLLRAGRDQVEEKDGHLFLYYQKDPTYDSLYYAGRIHSKGKFSTTYGFLECRIHLVKPNGHQTAFWMMPEGSGMRTPEGVDSTANDGAEIDIIEGNKTQTFSCGLHWDGYGASHQTNGEEIEIVSYHEQEYHTIGFEWSKVYLRWYIDGKMIRELTDPIHIPEVDHFIFLSGSMWSVSDWPDGNILFNDFIQKGGIDKAYVDYVRVFKRK